MIVQIVFGEIKYTGIKITERINREGKDTGVLLLQIDLSNTDMPQELIAKFYHYGMIDYVQFRLNPKTEKIINSFGEKFTLVAGNIAIQTHPKAVGCKIFASFPEADSHTYRPSRKRIFISDKLENQEELEMAVKIEDHIDFSSLFWLHDQNSEAEKDESINNYHKEFIKEYQKTPELPRFFLWQKYRLMAEGHYTQIWAPENWNMLLPFIGEGDKLGQNNILNKYDPWPEFEDSYMQDAQTDGGDTIPTIDSNYRDI